MTQKTFDQLKKNSNKLSENLFNKLKQSKEKKAHDDDRFWRAKQDSAGNASAIIRFLPAPDMDEPFVQVFSHGFSHNGKWFIHNCPTTKGKPCPVCEENSVEWKNGDKDFARSRKRNLSFITNILVVNDPANPENNGKVFLLKYGKKIQDKILEAMVPSDPLEEPIDVFNMFQGVNFKLKIKKVGEYANFDSSVFEQKITAICGGDEDEMKSVYDSTFPLGEFIADDKFESYEKLKEEFDKLYSDKVNRRTTIEDTEQTDTDTESEEEIERLLEEKLNGKKTSSVVEEDEIPDFDVPDDNVSLDDSSDAEDEDFNAQLKALIDED